jgi:hypothetical protein
MISASQAQEYLSTMRSKILPSSTAAKTPVVSPTKSLEEPKTPTAIPPQPKKRQSSVNKAKGSNVVEQLNSLMTRNENQGSEEDSSGPFDFRTLLKKTDFAPTASIRKRKGK